MTLPPLDVAIRENDSHGVVRWLYPTPEQITLEEGRLLVERCLDALAVLDSVVPLDDPCASDWRNDNARDLAESLRLVGTFYPELVPDAMDALRRIASLALTVGTRAFIADTIEYLVSNYAGG